LTGINKVSIGENVYNLLGPIIQPDFHELTHNEEWKYINPDTDILYKIYTTN